jgi:hypothetical protein
MTNHPAVSVPRETGGTFGEGRRNETFPYPTSAGFSKKRS